MIKRDVERGSVSHQEEMVKWKRNATSPPTEIVRAVSELLL